MHEIGRPFDLVVHGFDKSLRAPDYLGLHPLGRVPCLLDGPVRLFESGAICEYLCEQYDPGLLWRWPGHEERPDWLNWLHFAETMASHCAALTQQHIVIRDDADRSSLVMWLEAKRLAKALGVLEAALEGRDHLLAGGFSAVDTGVGYSVDVARRFVDLADFPRVAGYHQRLSGRRAFRASLPEADAPRIYQHTFYPPPDPPT